MKWMRFLYKYSIFFIYWFKGEILASKPNVYPDIVADEEDGKF